MDQIKTVLTTTITYYNFIEPNGTTTVFKKVDTSYKKSSNANLPLPERKMTVSVKSEPGLEPPQQLTTPPSPTQRQMHEVKQEPEFEPPQTTQPPQEAIPPTPQQPRRNIVKNPHLGFGKGKY